MTSTLLVLLLSQAQRPDSPTAGALPAPRPASMAGGGHSLARVDAMGLAFLPGSAEGNIENYVQLTPMRVLDGGEGLGVHLGAPVRLRPEAFASGGLGVDHAC